MQTYQLETSVSDRGVINLHTMPHLFNKKVRLIIISTDNRPSESTQRKRAFDRLLNRQAAMPARHLTDNEIDSIRHEYLAEKYK
jgi:hypothetical protein